MISIKFSERLSVIFCDQNVSNSEAEYCVFSVKNIVLLGVCWLILS